MALLYKTNLASPKRPAACCLCTPFAQPPSRPPEMNQALSRTPRLSSTLISSTMPAAMMSMKCGEYSPPMLMTCKKGCEMQ